MDLGFSVNLGPLSQISVPLFGIDTAVQLAVGSYGWWKARERRNSLQHLLGCKGAQITSPSTFNSRIYAQRRADGGVRGSTAQDGALTSLALPNASTAADQPMACLRALVTALLCFYGQSAVTKVLAEVVPQSLFHYDLDGVEIQVDGPLLAAFSQYVQAVTTEEDNDILRQQLLERVATRQSTLILGGASLADIIRCDPTHVIDAHNVVGLMQWTLTPSHKRSTSWYPTRSLTVWALALVMSELGFEITAWQYAVASETAYLGHSSTTAHFGSHPQVVLVASSVGRTDLCAPPPTNFNGTDLDRKPQRSPIQAIPLVLYRHLAASTGPDQLSAQYLYDIWQHTFRHATAATGVPRWTVSGMVKVDLLLKPDSRPIFEEHRSLVSLWSPHLGPLIGPVMSQYISRGASEADVLDFNARLHGPEAAETFQEQSEASRDWHIMVTLVLASVFAVACKALRVDGAVATPLAEMAFSPNLLFGDQVTRWANTVGLALNGTLTPAEWSGFLLEIATGAVHPVPLGEFPKSASLHGRSFIHALGKDKVRLSDVFGMQANGVTIINNLLVSPSVQPDSLLYYHVQYGQILHLPMDDSGYVRAAAGTRGVSRLTLNPEPDTTLLQSGASNANVRIDVEPDWEGDPRTVIFRARVDGLPRTSFSPLVVATRLSSRKFRAECQCRQFAETLEVKIAERWQDASVMQLIHAPGLRLGVEDEDRVNIPVAGSVAAQLLCIGFLDCDRMVLAEECMSCAHHCLGVTSETRGKSAVILAAVTPRTLPPTSSVLPHLTQSR